jgi:hypothetical protein
MQDYLIKIGETKLKYILSGGYDIQENQDIILSKKTMADGTERRNIAEKKKTTIKIKFSQIDGATLQQYSNLWKNDFEANYWSKDERTYKTATFRVNTKPTNSVLYSVDEIYDEFTVTLESV